MRFTARHTRRCRIRPTGSGSKRPIESARLPSKAAREAHLAEIRSVRLITLNYCPMGCTFCSATNFLHEAQGSVASVARLEAEECLAMIERIVAAHPRARTVIFQDDIFTFTRDRRILPLCEAIVAAKAERTDSGASAIHQHQSHRRDDHRAPERHAARRLSRAGFRHRELLAERARRSSTRRRSTVTSSRCSPRALATGVTPFLDLILSSPHAALEDVARDAARGVSLAAPGVRDRHVSVRHPVLRSGASHGSEALLPHTHYAQRNGRRHRRHLATSR